MDSWNHLKRSDFLAHFGGKLAVRLFIGIVLVISLPQSLIVGAASADEIDLIRREAESNAFMQGQLGGLYWLRGNYKEALKWLQAGANQGDSTAQYWLAVMYEDGNGIPQDYKNAARWFRKAAEQGNSGAQRQLGILYLRGHGVPQSNIRAHMWLNLSAANGGASGLREMIAEKLTAAQIDKAQEMARLCYSSDYKNCD